MIRQAVAPTPPEGRGRTHRSGLRSAGRWLLEAFVLLEIIGAGIVIASLDSHALRGWLP